MRLAWMLPLADLLLRTVGFGRLHRQLSRVRQARSVSADMCVEPTRVAELARLVGHRHPWKASCLRQSLVVGWLLRRRGLSPTIVIGVAKQLDVAPAHAWVQLDGIALDPNAQGHHPFGDLSR